MTSTATSTEQGKAAAFVVYVLYLFSIPSGGGLALVGVIVALVTRGDALPLWRQHLDQAVRLFFVMLLWGAALLVAAIVAGLLTVILIGWPLLWLIATIWFVIMLWFTVKSVLGFVALLDNRAP